VGGRLYLDAVALLACLLIAGVTAQPPASLRRLRVRRLRSGTIALVRLRRR
jgi:hypothetical protein